MTNSSSINISNHDMLLHKISNRQCKHAFRQVILWCLLCLMSTWASAQTQTGKASYYAKRATGARTASGTRLHHDSLTCAHRTYPFGTMLKVTHMGTGKEVIVKVNDRGPFVRSRIIDLSWGAARQLGMLAQGVAMVKVEVVNKTDIPYRPSETIEMPEMDYQVSDQGFEFPIPIKTPEQSPLPPPLQETE